MQFEGEHEALEGWRTLRQPVFGEVCFGLQIQIIAMLVILFEIVGDGAHAVSSWVDRAIVPFWQAAFP